MVEDIAAVYAAKITRFRVKIKPERPIAETLSTIIVEVIGLAGWFTLL